MHHFNRLLKSVLAFECTSIKQKLIVITNGLPSLGFSHIPHLKLKPKC